MSDRKLAKKIGVSQPTVTRRRTTLEHEGILDFTAIPNLTKLSYEIMAFTFTQYSLETRQKLRKIPELSNKIETTLKENPNIIYASSGKGLGFDGVAISIHKNYSDYVTFTRNLEDKWGGLVEKIDSFVVSMKSDNIIRFPTFKHWAESLRQSTKESA